MRFGHFLSAPAFVRAYAVYPASVLFDPFLVDKLALDLWGVVARIGTPNRSSSILGCV